MPVAVSVGSHTIESPIAGELSASVVVTFDNAGESMQIRAVFPDGGSIENNGVEAIRAARRLARRFADGGAAHAEPIDPRPREVL